MSNQFMTFDLRLIGRPAAADFDHLAAAEVISGSFLAPRLRTWPTY
jgi:hypothetical protein